MRSETIPGIIWNMLNLSIDDVIKEFGDTDQALIDAWWTGVTVIRPPYGDCNDEIISALETFYFVVY